MANQETKQGLVLCDVTEGELKYSENEPYTTVVMYGIRSTGKSALVARLMERMENRMNSFAKEAN